MDSDEGVHEPLRASVNRADSIVSVDLTSENSEVPEHGLTVTTGALAMISTIVGGGIVSLPYAMYQFGLPLALCVNLLVMTLVYQSVACYLNLKDMIPD
jgi:hypothetical protein